MNVKELRIGNYILDDDGSWSYINGFSPPEHLTRCDTDEGCSILIDIIGTDGAISRNWAAESSDCKPIPITAEWLERFGFIKTYKIYYLQIEGHSHDGVYFRADKDREGENYYIDCLCRGNHFANIPINYIHTLQNLYYALTGEELTIKTE